jgi:hypothetical protein
MTSRSLDPVVAKIDTSSSNQNLYRSFSLEDRIALQATPLSNNSTGSAKALVSDFTQPQFGAFDTGRETASIAGAENCYETCMATCLQNAPNTICNTTCSEQCFIDARKDFI